MQVTVRKFTDADLPAADDRHLERDRRGGSAQLSAGQALYGGGGAREFFGGRSSFTGVAEADGKVLGLSTSCIPTTRGAAGISQTRPTAFRLRDAGPRRGGKSWCAIRWRCARRADSWDSSSTPSSVPTRRRSSSLRTPRVRAHRHDEKRLPLQGRQLRGPLPLQ